MKFSKYLLLFLAVGYQFYSISSAPPDPDDDDLGYTYLPVEETDAPEVPEPSTTKPPETLVCGGTLTSWTGSIEYKTFENVIPNERCIWIIRPPHALNINLNVRQGVTSPDHLSVLAIRRFASDTYHNVSNTGTYRFNDAQMLFVSLIGGNGTTARSGFRLEYTSTNSTAPTIPGHVIQVSNANKGFGYIRYPPYSAQMYGNDELTAIVLKPVDNVYNPDNPTNIAYFRNGLQNDTCNDMVEVYSWLTPMKAWGVSRICGGQELEVILDRDLVVVLFKSDSSLVNTGFYVMFGGRDFQAIS